MYIAKFRYIFESWYYIYTTIVWTYFIISGKISEEQNIIKEII